jgi:hypothetical protein
MNQKTGWSPPPMLAGLLHRPIVGGLVVPWVTVSTPDGRHLFGSVNATRHDMALHQRLCQTCGQPLGRLTVFAMRPADIARMLSPEAGMHPWCAAYSARACPMLAGAMTHYRASSQIPTLPEGFHVQTFAEPARAGAKADIYHQVWTAHYRPMRDPITRRWAALVTPDEILRIRHMPGTA